MIKFNRETMDTHSPPTREPMTSRSFASGLKLLMLQHHFVVPRLHEAQEPTGAHVSPREPTEPTGAQELLVLAFSCACDFITCLCFYLPGQSTSFNWICLSHSAVILLQNIISSQILPRLHPILRVPQYFCLIPSCYITSFDAQTGTPPNYQLQL